MNTRPRAWSRGRATETSSFTVTRTIIRTDQSTHALSLQTRPLYFGFFAAVQVRLAQQQKEMAEERAYLKEIISRMDTQLHEQQRQLEKVRM